MPIVTIQVTREGSGPGRSSVTADEKAQLIAGVSQLLLDVLHKPARLHFRRDRGGRAGELGLGRFAGPRVPQAAILWVRSASAKTATSRFHDKQEFPGPDAKARLRRMP